MKTVQMHVKFVSRHLQETIKLILRIKDQKPIRSYKFNTQCLTIKTEENEAAEDLNRPCDNKKTFIKHVKSNQRYKCNLCDYYTSSLNNLKNHMCVHTGEKPFKCNICNYCCVQSSTLKQHMHTHTGEKPHKCSICSYSGARSSTLKQHILKHTGEKPHKCNVCNYSFAFTYFI